MNNRHYFLIGFGIMVLLQLVIPAKMVIQSEDTLARGSVFKFKTAPVDPTDPFRGKYVTLSFEANSFGVYDAGWQAGQDVFVLLEQDEDGYAQIQDVSKDRFSYSPYYVKAKVRSYSSEKITIQYPFDRFYMEESKALPAEKLYRQMTRATDKTAFAVVSVLDGKAVLKDVQIDGESLKTLVEAQLREKTELTPD